MQNALGLFGTPDAIRTHDLQSRSLTLYPAELQAHKITVTVYHIFRKLQGLFLCFRKFTKYREYFLKM